MTGNNSDMCLTFSASKNDRVAGKSYFQFSNDFLIATNWGKTFIKSNAIEGLSFGEYLHNCTIELFFCSSLM